MTLPALTIVPAGAGSGKTFKIQTDLIEWIKDKDINVRPERIVAVTFTEAAANELRERIRSALLADKDVQMEQVLALDQAYITTIHSFGLRLIQEYCFEGGWSPLPRLLTDDESDVLIRQTLATTRKADAIMSDLAHFGYQWSFSKGSAEGQFRSRLSSLIQKHRVIGLRGVQKEIKRHLLSKIKELYGRTDNGKTLEQNLHNAVKKLLKNFPDSLENLHTGNKTYISKMKENYRDLQKACRKNQLHKNWQLWVSLQDLRTSMRGAALPEEYDLLAGNIMEAASKLYRHPGPLDDALEHAEALVDAAQDCLQQNTILKRDKRLVDYGDMLSLAQELLASKPDVLKDLCRNVDCVVIDEFQDTNPLQFSLLWALRRQGIPTLIVGDIKQAIMGFQDADSRLLEELVKSDIADNSTPLCDNWRTVKPLMDILNTMGSCLFPSSYQRLIPRVEETSQYQPLQIINFRKNTSKQFCGNHIASHVKSILKEQKSVLDSKKYRPVRGGDIAILLPTNSLIETYASSFRDAGLTVQIDETGWFESRSVQLLYYSLLFVADPGDRHAALYMSATELGNNSLQDGIKSLMNDEELYDPVLEKISTLHIVSKDKDVCFLVQKVIADLDLFNSISFWPDAEKERANILRLVAEADEFNTIKPETLEASGLYGFGLKTFLAWLLKRQEIDNTLPRSNAVNNEAITLTTWHKAKGREWPIVAVCGTSKDYKVKLPSLDIQYQDFSDFDEILNKADIEFSPYFAAKETNENFITPLLEEAEKNVLRLLYVAMTRAKEHLILERTGHQEEKGTLSYWNLLHTCTEMGFTDTQIHIGVETYDCPQINIDKEEAGLEIEEEKTEMSLLSPLGIRALEIQALPDLTPELQRPSELSEKGSHISLPLVKTMSYGSPLTIDLGKNPVETGIILHRCFEVLNGREDNTGVLEDVTGYEFSGEQKSQLQQTVSAFEQWCSQTFGDYVQHREIPVTYQSDDGIVVSGVIDLLIEIDVGYWIIDHKTHRPDNPDQEFLAYMLQLHAYKKGIEKQADKNTVLGIGVHWASSALITLSV